MKLVNFAVVINRQLVINSFIANTNRKDRVFYRFIRLCAASGSGEWSAFLYLV